MIGPLSFVTQPPRYGRNGRSLSTATDCLHSYSSNSNSVSMNWSFGTNRIALAYSQRCSTIGHTVRATLGNGNIVAGLAEGIGQDGSLHVRPQATQPGSGTPELVHL